MTARRTQATSRFLLVFFLTILFIANGVIAEQFSSSDYTVLDPVIAPSQFATSTSFQLWSSLGEIAVGTSSSASFSNIGGFLPFPAASTPVVSATAGAAQVALSWTVSTGYLGWTVSSYTVGQSTTSGGPYSYTILGNVTSSTRTGLVASTPYYFVIVVNDIFGNAIATSTQVSATPTAAGGGGGGGGGGSETKAIFSGRSYPDSRVTILKDGQVVSTTPVGETASFSVTVKNLKGGTYLFGVYAEDDAGTQSSVVPIPVSITEGATTEISGIFLAPTISTDKKEVKKGNPIRVFGKSVPQSTITISVHSEQELYFQTPSDANGVYAYSFLTTPLELGDHGAQSNASKSGEISRTSKVVAFKVGNRDIFNDDGAPAGECSSRRGDLNKDNRVNLIDFSIEAFWYKRLGFPICFDLNTDGLINIVDFSIMAANWTG